MLHLIARQSWDTVDDFISGLPTWCAASYARSRWRRSQTWLRWGAPPRWRDETNKRSNNWVTEQCFASGHIVNVWCVNFQLFFFALRFQVEEFVSSFLFDQATMDCGSQSAKARSRTNKFKHLSNINWNLLEKPRNIYNNKRTERSCSQVVVEDIP